jgi:hypothetical protein
VSIVADAENRNKTRTYQTKSGKITSIIESCRSPIGDSRKTVLLEISYSKHVAHHWTWYVTAPCVWQIVAAPMSEEEHAPAKIILFN